MLRFPPHNSQIFAVGNSHKWQHAIINNHQPPSKRTKAQTAKD